jgi:Sigma-70 region 2
VQETWLRAWQYRDSLKEGAPLRPWLYRVSTNACLDAIARDERRAVLAARAAAEDSRAGTPNDVVWLRPIPDSVLEPPTPPTSTPEAITLASGSCSRGCSSTTRPWRSSRGRRVESELCGLALRLDPGAGRPTRNRRIMSSSSARYEKPICLTNSHPRQRNRVLLVREVVGYESTPLLKRCLSIFSARIFDSSVDRGIPSLAAAPSGPDTRPLLSIRAGSAARSSPA